MSLASLVILMEKAFEEFASFTEQSLVRRYLQLPWKLKEQLSKSSLKEQPPWKRSQLQSKSGQGWVKHIVSLGLLGRTR